MKIGFEDLNKSQVGKKETNKGDFKQRTVLDEFLELQKEFVSKKRKLKSAHQRRNALLGEVLFLRQRRRRLLKCKSFDSEIEKDEGKVATNERYISSGCEAKEGQNRLNLCSNLNSEIEPRYDEVQEARLSW